VRKVGNKIECNNMHGERIKIKMKFEVLKSRNVKTVVLYSMAL